MQDHGVFMSSLLKINVGPNSTLQGQECRNIKPLSVRSLKLIMGQSPQYKPRNAEILNLYQVAPKNLFLAKFDITSKGMQEHRTFISSILNNIFGPNSTLQAKKCRSIEPLSVRS